MLASIKFYVLGKTQAISNISTSKNSHLKVEQGGVSGGWAIVFDYDPSAGSVSSLEGIEK